MPAKHKRPRPPNFGEGTALAWALAGARTRPQRRKLFREWVALMEATPTHLKRLLDLFEPVVEEAHELLRKS